MKKALPILLLSAAPLAAQDERSVTTDPIGINKVTCLANSDTIVGVPLRVQGSISSKLVAVPVIDPENGDAATLTLAHNALPALGTHYLKFNGGSRDGRWYDITANSGNSVTLNLNGDNLDGVTGDESVLIAEYWTLNTLFPPDKATTDPTTTGHAIVASTTRFAAGRGTELLLPDLKTAGTNLAPNKSYYIFNSGWRLQGASYTEDYGQDQLNPDAYIIIRHPGTVTSSTTFRCLGEVELGSFTIPLATQGAVYQDNAVAIPRPINVTLNNLGLVPDAFVASTSRFASGRKDELLVFNNATLAFNKAPDVTYYYFNDAWRKQGEAATDDFGNDEIPAGSAFIIRKSPNTATDFWINPATYSNSITP